MAQNGKKYLPAAVIVLVIVVVAGIQYFKNQNSSPEQDKNQTPNEQQQSGDSQQGDEPEPANPEQLTGTLKISDDLKRGNLMLATDERNIYVFTSRDYSALLDKPVIMEIDGSLDNFRLVDIKAK